MPAEDTPLVEEAPRRHRWLFECTLSIIGPGLLVSLADTDFACLLQAADTGARFGYSGIIGLQFLLFPALFVAQELTVRLGTHTMKGHGACIKEQFGKVCAWVTFTLLTFSCVLAIVAELSGIAGVASICGLGNAVSASVAALLLIVLVCVAPYRVVERVALCFGVFEVAFLLSWGLVHPSAHDFFAGMFRVAPTADFAQFAAANVGAVIMPWMIYFQQSAVAAKRISAGPSEAAERTGTLLGAVLTQLIMVGTIVTFAASRQRTQTFRVEDVSRMEAVMVDVFGGVLGRTLLAFGLFGGAVCAAIVVALATSWALCDTLSHGTAAAAPRKEPTLLTHVHDPVVNPMDLPAKDAPVFYGCFAATVVAGLVALLAGMTQETISLISTSANAVLMPVTLLFLWLLAQGDALPPGVRITGVYKWSTAVVFVAASIFALVSTILGLAG